MASYTLTRRDGTTETIETDLTVAEAAAIVRSRLPVTDFHASLVRSAEAGRLTDRQLPWLMKLATGVDRPGPYLSIVELLSGWQAKARGRVSLRLQGLTLKAVSRGPNTGAAYLYDEGGSYAGKITATGEFVGTPGTFADLLKQAAVDPVAAARQYGHETGICACCGRVLTDPVSVFGGIGPICLATLAGADARKQLEREYKSSRKQIHTQGG